MSKLLRLSVLLSYSLAVLVHADERPNILLFMAEDMSPRVGAFGDSVAVTPNLDALAQQGVRFTQVFTTSGVCAPSRAALMLGAHQISTGTQHMRSFNFPQGGYYSVPPAEMKAFPELLRREGYYTFTDNKLDYQFSNPLANSGPFSIWDSEGDANAAWRGRREGQPFFGLINFEVTHESGLFPALGNMPSSLVHLFFQLRRWWLMSDAVEHVVAPEDVVIPPYYPETPTVRQDIAQHYNNIAAMDAELGSILRQLEAEGLADTTIVIWTTDHGDGLPRAKRELFDAGIHVPMIIRWPEKFRPKDVELGAVDARLISFVDLAPTILAMTGTEAPEYLHGVDVLDPRNAERQYVYAARDRIDAVDDRQRAVRDKRFKYIRSWYPELGGGHALAFRDNINMAREMRALYASGKLNAEQSAWYEAPGEERLFDLEADIHELKDVSGDPRYAKTLERMRGALQIRLQRLGDWSEEPEAQMVARFKPDGKRARTLPPQVFIEEGNVVIEEVTPGSSLAWRIGEERWNLYTAPIKLSTASTIEVKAVRYGWEDSPSVKFKYAE